MVRRGNSFHCAEHYFIIEDVVVHRGFIDLKVSSFVSRGYCQANQPCIDRDASTVPLLLRRRG